MNQNKRKKIIELEGKLDRNKYYVFRADGVDFKEFRVGKINDFELKILYNVYFELSRLIFNKFGFVQVIYYFDDEINLAFKGNDISYKRRVQKNLSILSSFVSVQFNKLISDTKIIENLKRTGDYIFDGRFIEISDKKNLKKYFVNDQRKSHCQVKNSLSAKGMTDKKPDIDTIIKNKLISENEFCLFGCFLGRGMEPIKMKKGEKTLISNISDLIDNSFK